MTCDERIEKILNRAGQTISDLPEGYLLNACEAKAIQGVACRWFVDEDAPEGVALRNLVSIPLYQYILHLTDVIDRLETALDNQVTLHEHLIHVIGNADIPEGVSYDQFCLVVDSIYKAIQTAQEGWENYEDGVPKDGSVDDENR